MGKIGFLEQTKNINQVMVEENFTNAICYGKTGSGKTTGFMLPNIENRIKNDHGILIYDFKGNIHQHIKNIAKKYDKLDSVYEIGKPWGKKINLIKSINSKTLRSLFSNLSGDTIGHDYWDNAAANILENIYIIHKNLSYVSDKLNALDGILSNHSISIKLKNKYEVSLKSLFKSVNEVSSIVSFLNNVQSDLENIDSIFEDLVTLIPQYSEIKDILKMAIFNFDKAKNSLDALKEYQNMDTATNSDSSGKYGVLNVLNSILSSAAINEYINKDEFNIVEALRDKKIVIINLNDINNKVLGMFNLLVYQDLQKSILHTDKLSKVSIFIDEAQKVLHSDYLPDTDVCRESRFEYIFATQDKLLLYTTIGTYSTEQLLRNVVEQYSFATNQDDNDTNKLDKFEYKNLISNKKYFAKPLFFDKKEIFETEYIYQKNNNILDLVNIKENKKRYIIEFIPEYFEDSDVLVKFEDNTTQIVKYQVLSDDILLRYSIKEGKKLSTINNDNVLESLQDEEVQGFVKYEVSSIIEDSSKMQLERLINEVVSLKNNEKIAIKKINSLSRDFVDIKKVATSASKATDMNIRRLYSIEQSLKSIKTTLNITNDVGF